MGYDLMQELQQKRRQLDVSVKQLRKSGTDYAEAERTYKITLAKECLQMRDDGMAIGLIDKVCYGVWAVADARFKRDITETVYKANLEAINSLKLQIRIIEGQISREWGSPNGTG